MFEKDLVSTYCCKKMFEFSQSSMLTRAISVSSMKLAWSSQLLHISLWQIVLFPKKPWSERRFWCVQILYWYPALHFCFVLMVFWYKINWLDFKWPTQLLYTIRLTRRINIMDKYAVFAENISSHLEIVLFFGVKCE